MRHSLNSKQRPEKHLNDLKPLKTRNMNTREKESTLDLSYVYINDDFNLLSPDHQESIKKKDEVKKCAEFSKSHKSSMRDSLGSIFDKNVNPFENINYDQCLLHGKPADLICLKDKTIVCCNCALFGEHKGHDVMNL